MDTSSTIRRLLGEYERVRMDNRLEGQRRELKARQTSSRVAKLLDERRTLLTQSMQQALCGKRVMEDITAQFERMNLTIREALAEAGFPEDYLQPVCRCALCRDTGYVGEPGRAQGRSG